jgi:peptidoglycan/LPS O-acetylase OafA/YrhL
MIPAMTTPFAQLVAVVALLVAGAAAAWRRGLLRDPRRADEATLHLRKLDGLRGIAVLSVLAFHVTHHYVLYEPRTVPPLAARPFASGDLGLDLFFVLSGFLLYRTWTGIRTRGSLGVSVAEYAKRRALRILPAFWLCLAIIIPLFSKDLLSWAHAGTLAAFATVQQWNLQPFPITVNGVTWTLTVESHFYVLLPALAVAFRRRAVAAAAALIAVSLLWRTWTFVATPPRVHMEFIFGRLDQFAVGMLAAVLAQQLRHPLTRIVRTRIAGWVLGAGLAAVVFVNGSVGLAKPASLELWVHPVAGALLGLLVLRWASGVGGRLLAHPVLVFLGLVSYGIYLWQIPFLDRIWRWGWLVGRTDARSLTSLALVIVGIFAAGVVSFAFVERPALRLRRAWAVRRGASPPARTPVSVAP